MDWKAILWMVLTALFLVVEGACPFHLVSVWFAAGSVAAMIVALLGGSLAVQVVVFFAVSVALLLAMWPLVKKVIKPRIVKTNVDAVLGTRGYVTADIDNLVAVGQVKLGGMYWTARSLSGDPIPAGTLVQVDHIEGVKVFVTPVKEAEKVKV